MGINRVGAGLRLLNGLLWATALFRTRSSGSVFFWFTGTDSRVDCVWQLNKNNDKTKFLKFLIFHVPRITPRSTCIGIMSSATILAPVFVREVRKILYLVYWSSICYIKDRLVDIYGILSTGKGKIKCSKNCRRSRRGNNCRCCGNYIHFRFGDLDLASQYNPVYSRSRGIIFLVISPHISN